MKAPRTTVARIIAQRALRSNATKQDAQAVAAYLLAEGRTSELASILRDVQADWARNGYVEVVAESAHQLSPADLKDVETEARRAYPHAQTISVTTHVHPELVGGVRLKVIDKQLDLTTRAKLQLFKRLAVHGKDA